jgi:hypothetical protein
MHAETIDQRWLQQNAMKLGEAYELAYRQLAVQARAPTQPSGSRHAL